ncbi:hypothetical protein [Lichenihabitans psoromatis]|uniref:hypothetical protein n=1 Tax=Lichenihabitans psoromatis TaxID=2528642 RepID=UPI0010368EBA|nr:hypothetical protein [Lichenihabitans psoromatis]
MTIGRKTGGRQLGTPNKATADLKAAAAFYTKEMLIVLVEIANKGESEAARVAAANSILDRAHGKPTQTIAGDKDNPLLVPVLNVTITSHA